MLWAHYFLIPWPVDDGRFNYPQILEDLKQNENADPVKLERLKNFFSTYDPNAKSTWLVLQIQDHYIPETEEEINAVDWRMCPLFRLYELSCNYNPDEAGTLMWLGHRQAWNACIQKIPSLADMLDVFDKQIRPELEKAGFNKIATAA